MDTTSTEAVTVGGAPLKYLGKYKLVANINPSRYLTVSSSFAVGGSTSESDAAVFAMYSWELAGYVFQHIPKKPTDPGGGFLSLQRNGDYAQGVCTGDLSRAMRVWINWSGDDTFSMLDFTDVQDPRDVVGEGQAGFRFWLPKPGHQFVNPWQRVAVKAWNDTSMNGADLTFVQLADRNLGAIDLTKADLQHASLARTTLNGAKLGEAKFDAVTSFNGGTLRSCDLTAAVFSGADFRDTDASGCTFGEADLTALKFSSKTKFAGADLKKAKFDGGDLAGVDFTKAKLSEASFVNAKLAGAKLNEADLTGAKLSGATFAATTDFSAATLYGIDFTGCNLTQAVFSPKPVQWYDSTKPVPVILAKTTIPIDLLGLTDWSWLNLLGATINGTLPTNLANFKAEHAVFPDDYDLTGRDITNANFSYARMHGVILNNAEADDDKGAPDFSYADLTKAKMYKVDLKQVNFSYATLRGITLGGGSMLFGAKFNYAKLHSEGTDVADLSYAILIDATFEGATLGSSTAEVNGANFSYAIIYGSGKFDNATLPRAQFAGAYLAGVSFQNIENKSMAAAIFTNACLVNCKFGGTSLASASLNNACLQGANLSAAKLSGAQLGNAAIARAAGTIEIKNFPIPSVKSLTFQPTQIDNAATDASTVCPSGPGPCTGEKWYSSAAPTSWSYTGKAWLGRTVVLKE